MSYVSLTEVKAWLWLPVSTTQNLDAIITSNPTGTVTRRALTWHNYAVWNSVTLAGVETDQLGTFTITVVSDADHFDVDTGTYTAQTPPWDSSETAHSDKYDTKLVSLIAYTKWILDDNIWDLTSQDWTETITSCDIQGYYHLLLRHTQISALKSIWWVSYAWTLDTDYKILAPQKRKLWINDIYAYVPSDKKYYDVVYTAWLATIPDKLKTAQLMLIELEFNREWARTIGSYTLWPRAVKFTTPEWEKMLNTIDWIINSYRIFNINW